MNESGCLKVFLHLDSVKSFDPLKLGSANSSGLSENIHNSGACEVYIFETTSDDVKQLYMTLIVFTLGGCRIDRAFFEGG